MIDVTFRPIDVWPRGELTSYYAQRRSPFSATIGQTWSLLDRELHQLGTHSRSVVIQLALDESQIRLDGKPRASATPQHPGVTLAFTCRHGDLKYATDVFSHWHANIRAIALGLEALRKVDRYGITAKGEQYAGWRQLAAGDPDGEIARGRELIREHGGVTEALKATHPDRGGDPGDFRAVEAARQDGMTKLGV